jgi:glycerol-3-phosphate O-acyltransferase/dihydroxyacetone phosphate acyltransferase
LITIVFLNLKSLCTAKFRAEVQPGDTITVGGRVTLIVTLIEDNATIRVKSPPPSDFPSTPEAASAYKIFPRVDQSQMFSQVTKRFREGRCVGIFPEGGSHDRTELLPLKAGAAIMVLNAMVENRELDVPIIPVGMNYFHAEKVRTLFKRINYCGSRKMIGT